MTTAQSVILDVPDLVAAEAFYNALASEIESSYANRTNRQPGFVGTPFRSSSPNRTSSTPSSAPHSQPVPPS